MSDCTGRDTVLASANASATAASTAAAAAASANACVRHTSPTKSAFGRDHADHPDQIVTHAERRGRAEVFGPVVAELEAVERLTIGRGEVFRLQIRAVGINQWIARVREREELGGFALSGYPASIGVREQDLIGGEEEHARMLAHRQAGDEIGERVQIEIGGEHATEFAARVLHRHRAGDAGHPLPIEDVGRQPNEPTGLLRPEVERALPRVVPAVVVGFQDLLGAVRQRVVFHQLRLAVHDVAVIDLQSRLPACGRPR